MESRRSRTYNMDAGRAFQLREQVIRRHRLVMAICGLALLVFACVVVAMVLKYVITNDQSVQEDGARELSVMGGWGQWLPWSPCTATCGGGQRSRRRYCDDPEPEGGGSRCDGQYELSETCSRWVCPDCDRVCKSGILNNCTYCVCPTTSFQGYVTDVIGTPINDVSIFVSRMQWLPYAWSSSDGQFVLRNMCPEELLLVFQKTGYKTVFLNATFAPPDSRYVSIVMEKLHRYKIVTHPHDQTVFEGSTLTLTCRGDSPKVTYEWFKDGNILSLPSERSGRLSQLTARMPKLVINNVDEKDSGVYRCRISSPGGMTFSQPAKVTIKAREIFDTCPSEPVSKYLHLPPNCLIQAENQSNVDIGRCLKQTCSTHREPYSKLQNQTFCCGPIRTNVSYVQCDGWSYPIVKIIECGCSVYCGVNVVGNRPIHLQTYLHDPIYGVTSSIQAFVQYNGTLIETSKSGSFTLSAPSNETELVLNIPASTVYNPAINVYPISSHTSSIQVTLQTKAAPIRVQSSQKMVFPVMSAEMTSIPVVSLVLPANAIVDNQGVIYENKTVDVYTQFLDPRSKTDILSVPGIFQYTTQEGQIFQLEFFGLVILFVESTNGTKLEINSKVTLTLNFAGLDIESEIDKDHQLNNYILNPDTGQWVVAEDKWNCGSAYHCSGKLRSTIDISKDVQFIMAARPMSNSNLCEVKVSSLLDEQFQNPIPGIQVLVLSRGATHYIHLSRGVTDNNGDSCLKIPCGCEHIIYTEGLVPAQRHQLPETFAYNNDQSERTVTISSQMGHLIKTGDGPVHLHNAHTCGSTQGEDYKFIFVLNKGEKNTQYSNLQNYGILMPVETRPHHNLSWYSHTEDKTERSTCAVRFHIQGGRHIGQILAISRKNNQEGPVLGTYTAMMTPTESIASTETSGGVVNMLYACVQVRCPITDTYGRRQSTHVTIHLLQSCQINTSNKISFLWDQFQPHKRHTSLGFVISSSDSSIGENKGYFRASGRGDTSEQWAMYQCMTSSNYAAQLQCEDAP